MAGQTKKTSPFSLKNMYKSIFFPSSSGEAAAIEHIGNNRIKRTAYCHKNQTETTIKKVGKKKK